MNPMKNWIIDRMASGLYQGDRSPGYWAAVALRQVWGRGFDRA